MTYMNHDEAYPADYLAEILNSTKTIAMVGASPDRTKFSYGVLRVLHETGYDMIPVNPRSDVTEIRGLKVYHSLEDIERPVDMVQVFRPSEELLEIGRQAIKIGAKVLWGQIGVKNEMAARIAEDAGLKVVMNRCPKIELFRPFWKPRLNQAI
jgi:predicted CoA-binding protein